MDTKLNNTKLLFTKKEFKHIFFGHMFNIIGFSYFLFADTPLNWVFYSVLLPNVVLFSIAEIYSYFIIKNHIKGKSTPKLMAPFLTKEYIKENLELAEKSFWNQFDVFCQAFYFAALLSLGYWYVSYLIFAWFLIKLNYVLPTMKNYTVD